MKASILRELKGSLLLLLWLLPVQFLSAMLTGLGSVLAAVGAIIFGVFHLVGSTPLWQWILGGVLVCLLWFLAGWFMPCADQLRPGGAAVVLTIWTVLTSFMHAVYLLFLPQELCGGMIMQILQALYYDSGAWLDQYWDLPIGCFMLSAALGVGLILRRKHAKASHKTSGENA
jgi:hypothetical protein